MQKEAGAITLAEQKELTELLRADAEGQFIADGLHEAFSSRISYDLDKKEVESALAQFHERLAKEPALAPLAGGSRKQYRLWAAAAIVLLALGSTFFFMYRKTTSPAESWSENIVTTKKGSKTNLVLPDGTKVWVNSDSRLSYHKDYGNMNRDVFLSGEAFFEVKEDKAHPFIVHTQTLDVKVLGTVFNVRAYDNEQHTEAVLIRGSVEVQVKNGKTGKITLSPHEKIVVQNEDKQVKNKPVKPLPEVQLFDVHVSRTDSMAAETEWTKNRIVFDQEKLEHIVPVLERWYDVKIAIRKKTDGQLYNGTFENDKLEDVLEALQLIGNFRYRIDKNNVVIY
ncbi:FecR family protein [Niabella sp.]|uniref:FecR family protein n=1 Tax=Niabella sp. TaxID=1962976 RepID=UPI002638C263|nr:FecR family protein [Niabella sp.]